jgi:hypothetical protein
MKLSVDIRIVKDQTGKRALRVWPEIEGTDNNVTAFVVVLLVMLTIASFWAIAKSPDPITQPNNTVQIGGF